MIAWIQAIFNRRSKADLLRQIEDQKATIEALMSRPVVAFAELAYRVSERFGPEDPGSVSHFLRTHIAGHQDELQCLKDCEYTEPTEEKGG